MSSSGSRTKKHLAKRWTLNSLEPRLMLAGDVQAEVAPSAPTAETTPIENTDSSAPDLAELVDRTAVSSVVFIDAGVEDLEALQDAVDPNSEIVLIVSGSDGVQQITQHLARRQHVQAVHLVTHGSEGAVHFGNQQLSTQNIAQYANQLRAWRSALGRDADILLYGCETGKGNQGDQLMRAISHLTGADVAASDDVTGNKAIGADWDLERTVGTIDASLAFSNNVAGFSNHLGLISYPSFDSTAGLQLNGDATVTGGALRLTSDAAQQRGSAYYLTPISVDSGTSFQAQFTARFDGGQGSGGGEGLAFVIQNSPAGTSAQNIGPYPGGLNYNAVPNSIGIELDTLKNVYEQYADEITITVNGVMVTPVATTASPFDLNNGQSYSVWVDYDGENNLLSVFISDTNNKPQDAVLTANLELDQIVGDQAYLGFAAATGSAVNNTYIESWNVLYDDPVPTPGFFTLTSDAFSVSESSDSITIDVERVGGSAGTTTIQYTTSSGSAVAGSDFQSTSGTLTFGDGVTSQSITINLIDDGNDEGTESFSLTLSNPQGGAGLLSPDMSTINILDDDGVVNPNLPNYSSFGSADGLQLNGDATVTGGELRLVAAAAQQRGSAYYTTPISVDASTLR